MSRTVLFPLTSPLHLTDVARNQDGSIKSGFVENGCWHFEVREDECLAKGSYGHIVTRWPRPSEMPEVVVPPDWRGDYGAIIDRARASLAPNEHA